MGTEHVTLWGDERSSHWKARLIFAKAKRPSELLSCSLLLRVSCGMTLEMKEELLLRILLFGFRRFKESLVEGLISDALLSPNAGVRPLSGPLLWAVLILVGPELSSLSLCIRSESSDDRVSLGSSLTL